MKPFISEADMKRLEVDAFESGELLANVLLPHPFVSPPTGPVVDELGRAWVIPADKDGLRMLRTRYRQIHGRLSSAVDKTFTRHGRLNELRMLVMRCAEGEAINLAARALALGPVTPIPRRGNWPADRPWVWDQHDEMVREKVLAEEARMRAAGYVD